MINPPRVDVKINVKVITGCRTIIYNPIVEKSSIFLATLDVYPGFGETPGSFDDFPPGYETPVS